MAGGGPARRLGESAHRISRAALGARSCRAFPLVGSVAPVVGEAKAPSQRMTIIRGMNAIKGQLTLRGVVIGCVGCAVITASSVYVALKMGALPWPIVFAAILSLFLLKLISRGTSTLNEANVTHTIMSSGAMVAGGLAFTVPGAWMLGLAEDISLVQMLALALSGSALGLLGSILLRRHFIEDVQLEYPIGQAAAQTLKAGDAGGGTGASYLAPWGWPACTRCCVTGWACCHGCWRSCRYLV